MTWSKASRWLEPLSVAFQLRVESLFEKKANPEKNTLERWGSSDATVNPLGETMPEARYAFGLHFCLRRFVLGALPLAIEKVLSICAIPRSRVIISAHPVYRHEDGRL